MNHIKKLVDKFNAMGVEFWLDENDKLFCSADSDKVNLDFRQLLGLHREEIIEYLKKPVSSDLLKQEKRKLFKLSSTLICSQNSLLIHQFIENQANKTPDAVAFIFDDKKISYSELNKKANAFALHLTQQGVSKGDFVPLIMDAGFEVPFSILSLLKIGATYVPLDKTWPELRLKKILKQIEAKLILTNIVDFQSPLNSIPSQFFLLENLQKINENVFHKTKYDDKIYAMYTSGSTGEPKGAINLYKGIMNRLLYMDKKYVCVSSDVVLQTTKHIFDSSFWQFFWPLMRGACAVILKDSERSNPSLLISLIQKYKVTITDFVPTVLEYLLGYLEKSDRNCKKLYSLRQIFIGGEALNINALHRFANYVPNANLTNAYGPTETSIGVVFNDMPSSKVKDVERIAIGKPIDNVYCLILNENLEMSSFGDVGELYIGGECVGLGYVDDKKTTNLSFIKNPFKEINCSILYKTGDLVKWLPNETLEFIGRVDNQVKLNGLRVNIEEIETLLNSHVNITRSTVIVDEEISLHKKLIAFIQFSQNIHLDIDIYRDFLKKNLPNYMIPADFIPIENFPMNSSGKLDKKILLSIAKNSSLSKIKITLPKNDVEKKISEVWKKTLGLTSVCTRKNFFDVGGNSILAAVVFDYLKNIFDIKMSLIDLFRYPTISQFSDFIKMGQIDLVSEEL